MQAPKDRLLFTLAYPQDKQISHNPLPLFLADSGLFTSDKIKLILANKSGNIMATICITSRFPQGIAAPLTTFRGKEKDGAGQGRHHVPGRMVFRIQAACLAKTGQGFMDFSLG